MNKFFNIVFGRVLYTTLFIVLQVGFFVIMFTFFREKFAYFYLFGLIVSAAVFMHLMYKNGSPEYKLAWVIPILIFPIFGGFLYVLFTQNRSNKRTREKIFKLEKHYENAFKSNYEIMEKLESDNKQAAIQSKYIKTTSHCAAYQNTNVKYFKIGEEFFESVLQDLKQAKKFIFLEYFIIEEGFMWNSILEILKQKQQEGIEIRIMYDDFGCMFKLPQNYYKTLKSYGFKVHVFHKFNNILTPNFNNRDHRKILVIDGIIGYTGGINLADEYINKTHPLGHWKDTGVRLYGKGVWSFTVMFLSLWNSLKNIEEDFSKYRVEADDVKTDGFVQPFTDIPLDNYEISRTVYLNLINKAKDYVYITTPYLIIDNGVIEALCNAALSGVDVRIITPAIPDKKYIHFTSRSYYDVLIKNGVKIYEYTPGFIHAKSFVSDDEFAIIGTVNLDFRSLYLHYECAVWMYKSSCIDDIKTDFLNTIKISEQIKKGKKKKLIHRLFLSILRAFSPLL